jgi:hypothetical protein
MSAFFFRILEAVLAVVSEQTVQKNLLIQVT